MDGSVARDSGSFYFSVLFLVSLDVQLVRRHGGNLLI